jgi:sulfide:quinone oxidoreductase
MEQMDKAVFAQVPLALTGDPSAPIRIREGADSLYKIGSGRTWRLGKKALGYYLPFRFKAGEPFHAGAPWEAMDLSLKAMSSVLAR